MFYRRQGFSLKVYGPEQNPLLSGFYSLFSFLFVEILHGDPSLPISLPNSYVLMLKQSLVLEASSLI